MKMSRKGGDAQERIVSKCLMEINREQTNQRERMNEFMNEMRGFRDEVYSRLDGLRDAIAKLGAVNDSNVNATTRKAGRVETATVRQPTINGRVETPTSRGPPKIRVGRVTDDSNDNLDTSRRSQRSPVILKPDPPGGLRRPTPGKKRPRATFEVIYEPLPGNAIIKEQPQERDFMNLMKILGMDVNPTTTASVSSAAQVDSRVSTPQSAALDTVLVIDVSESMNGEPLTLLKKFVNGFTSGVEETRQELHLEERVAVIMCGATTAILQHFTNELDQLTGMLEQLVPEGKTPLMNALTLALCYIELQGQCIRIGDITSVPPRVIVVSDFKPTNDKAPFDAEDVEPNSPERIRIQKQLLGLAKKYKQQGYGLYCVPVGRECNKSLAKNLAENSKDGEVIKADDYKTTGNFLRYQAVVSKVVDTYSAASGDGDDPDINALLLEAMPSAGLTEEHTAGVTCILDKAIGDDDGGIEDIDITEEDPTPFGVENPDDMKLRTEGPLPKWKPTRNLEQFGYEEQAGLPAIGTRVRRGEDWSYDDQDGNGPGTIISHVSEGVLLVHFDNGYIGTYRYGYEEKHDVTIVQEPRIIDRGHIGIGCTVKRGIHWNRGDEDGGQVGVVIRKQKYRFVMVRWPSRVVDSYCFGGEGKWEVVVTDEVVDFSQPPPAPRVSESPVSPVSPPAPQSEENLKAYWKFNADNQWRPFSEETVTEIETKYQNSQDKALVKYKGKSMKVFLKDMRCELDGKQHKIVRELMNDDDIKSMIEMEKYLPPI